MIHEARAKEAAALAQKAKEKERRAQKARPSDYGELFGCDDTFSFIAGFTSGGVPYGTCWDEDDDDNDDCAPQMEDFDGSDPFAVNE